MSGAISLYVIGQEGGPYKIGISNNPRHRLKGLQTASPVPLSLVATAEVSDRGSALRIEGAAHARLGRHRKAGEWFECSSSEIIATISSLVAEDSAPEPAQIRGRPWFTGELKQIDSMLKLARYAHQRFLANVITACGAPVTDREGLIDWLSAQRASALERP